jgi:hypothetical protein
MLYRVGREIGIPTITLEIEMTLRQQVEAKFAGYEEERRQRVREEQRRKDREWAVWVDSDDALFEILKNPGLAVRPSDRPPPTGAELLKIMIAERKAKK